MSLSPQVVEQLQRACPELKQLPKGWKFHVGKDARISFVKDAFTSYNHPTLGGLPRPWILKYELKSDGSKSAVYYNRETRKQTKEDPRYMASTLALHSGSAPQNLWIAANMTKNSSKINLKDMKRTPIDRTIDIRDRYIEVHQIDDGSGIIGGMNGGVNVVAMKGLESRIFIEKKFKPADISFGKKEIEMMYRVNHPSLASYSAACILERATPPAASLYIEFCDRGSLEGLIKAYVTRRNNGDRHVKVSESFLWHAFLGLADGLAYLQSGVSYWQNNSGRKVSKWVSVLHRDVKPDNVLLRSRATLGSKRYFYCVLSDFGLACDDRDDRDPRADQYQVARSKLGTKSFWAPELCYNPYPKSYPGPQGEIEWKIFPNGHRHSKRSDLWALGASIYNLCVLSSIPQSMSHLNLNNVKYIPGMTNDKYLEGTECRERYLTIPQQYSPQLRKAILLATKWDPRERPDPVRFVQALGPLVAESGHDKQGKVHEPLPEWATKVHEYLSKAEKISKSNPR